jgi:hypothetical protein
MTDGMSLKIKQLEIKATRNNTGGIASEAISEEGVD